MYHDTEGGGGPRHGVPEDTGRLDVTVRASRWLRTSGRYENTLPLVGRLLGHVQFCREKEKGGWGGGGVES